MSKVIEKALERLTKSTQVSWVDGDLERWVNFANQMQDCIVNLVPIIKTSIDENDSSKHIKELEEQLREKDDLISILIRGKKNERAIDLED